MKIYTKTGDRGETSLFSGKRVLKNNNLIESYGTVDELNAVVGLAKSFLDAKSPLSEKLYRIQNELFDLGADLATPLNGEFENRNRIEAHLIEELEKEIDQMEGELSDLKNFILPGGSTPSAYLHLARTVCRRAERTTIELQQRNEVNSNVVMYLNRLSDWLFVASRFINQSMKVDDVIWQKTNR